MYNNKVKFGKKLGIFKKICLINFVPWKKFSFLIPCYNEEESLPELYAELSRFVSSKASVSVSGDDGAISDHKLDMTGYEWEFLMVNDGSRDGTLPLIEGLGTESQSFPTGSMHPNIVKRQNIALLGFR